MRFFALGILFTFLLPSFAFAAGFAKESLFLSKSPVIDGETVFIHAVFANESTAAFTGEVVFEDGEEKVGAVAVSIAPGGAQAVSLSWKPAAGSHLVVAELTAADKTVVEKLSATLVIQAKPKPDTASPSGSVQSSEGVREVIAGISPGAASAAEPVFATIDNLRQKGADLLDKGIVWAKESEVKGESAEGGIGGTVLSVVKTFLGYVMEFLRFILNNAGIFYPVVAIAFLYALWRLYKRMRRPRQV